MACFIGALGKFDPKSETVGSYEERLKLYLIANDIAANAGNEERRKAIFLTEVGKEIFQVLSDLFSPGKPADKTLCELLKRLKDHYEPVPNEMAESFKFWTRVQSLEESVTDYSLAIKRMTVHANFPDLNRWLRDRFVTGLNENYVHFQEKLSNMTQLTFEKAVEIAVNMTMVKENAKKFRSPGGSAVNHEVNAMSANRTKYAAKQHGEGFQNVNFGRKHDHQATEQQCWRCCGNHSPHSCKFKMERCFKCGKTGHIARSKACKGKSRVNVVSKEDDDTTLVVCSACSVASFRNGGIRVPVCIEGNVIDMQLDTAADVSLLPESLYNKFLSHVPLQPANIVLRTYDNQEVELVGKISVTVKYEDQQACHLPLIITKGTGKAALFGLQWLESIKLDWPKVCSVQASLSAVLEKHSDVFSEGIGTLTGAKANIYVDSSQPPKFCKPRSVPYAMKRKVEEELDRLVESKVIEPVRFSEWATPIVPVLKADGNIRIYAEIINKP